MCLQNKLLLLKSGIIVHSIKESYDCTVKLQLCYHEVCIFHLHIFWSSHCHFLYYNIQTHAPSILIPVQIINLPCLYYDLRLFRNLSFPLFQNTLVFISQAEKRLVNENQLTQIIWQSFENHLAQTIGSISMSNTPSSLGWMMCLDQRNLLLCLHALMPLWLNILLRAVYLVTLRPVAKRNIPCS